MMKDLIQPQNTIAVLQKYNFQFQKKYGQNFLIDPMVLERILQAASIGPEDFVLEIGPGIGTLTQALSAAAGSVVAVEIDRHLIPILQDTLSDCDNVEILQEDILKVDIRALSEKYHNGKPIKVLANLPYYITTPILMKLLESDIPLDSLTVMVQKEVAERMCSDPGTKEYGALSLAVQYAAEPKIVTSVPPNCFIPRPNAHSAVVHLKVHKTPPVTVRDPKLLFQVIRASFAQRRKTLQNGLKNAPELALSKEQAQACIEACGLSPTVRGETLSLEDFARLSDEIYEVLR